MKLKVLGSNSSGNCYILKSSTSTLLIELGVSIKDIKKALNFKLRNVAAIVSHSHGDHAKSIENVLKSGIKVYASIHTLDATKTATHHFANVIEAGKTYIIEGFKIKPFSVNHDVPTFGFMIHHPEMGTAIFLTDTYYCDYVFNGVNHFIVECNHDQQIMEEKAVPKFLKDRIIQSHMNIDTCKKFLLANDLSGVNNIVLIHLSDGNSDELRFKKEVTEITGKTVHVAVAGLEIDFNKVPI